VRQGNARIGISQVIGRFRRLEQYVSGTHLRQFMIGNWRSGRTAGSDRKHSLVPLPMPNIAQALASWWRGIQLRVAVCCCCRNGHGRSGNRATFGQVVCDLSIGCKASLARREFGAARRRRLRQHIDAERAFSSATILRTSARKAAAVVDDAVLDRIAHAPRGAACRPRPDECVGAVQHLEVASGFSPTTSRSASLPGSIEPIRSAAPIASAPLSVRCDHSSGWKRLRATAPSPGSCRSRRPGRCSPNRCPR